MVDAKIDLIYMTRLSDFVGYIYPFGLNSGAEGRRDVGMQETGTQAQNLCGRYSNMRHASVSGQKKQ